ncbi:MAG: rhodanese-like domain-containing protein [Flavobacteriaceae bacterium]|nr:rhodanese-like domain-containing protein [Flavobacteriaceae bacterium]
MYFLLLVLFSQTISNLQSVDDFAVLMGQEYVLVDVRSAEEFAQGALPNAINISVNAIDFPFEISRLDKDLPVLIYCKSGARSARAAIAMKALGFETIHELEGGYLAWEAAKKLKH